MPDKDNEMLKYNHGEKSLKAPFMVYADLKYLLENSFMSNWSWKILYREKN